MKIVCLLFPVMFIFQGCQQSPEQRGDIPIDYDAISGAQTLLGLEFSESEQDSMISGLIHNRTSYENIRRITLENSIPPAFVFNPVPVDPVMIKDEGLFFADNHDVSVDVPDDLNELAFSSIRELSYLIREGKITSTELTEMYLSRLKRYGGELECVITLTEERALEQAERADREIASGIYRGPLHGIPYGAKDLLSVKGYKTTWGAMPFREQVIDEDATVIRKLDSAGAVLVAKLTLGALAWGDVWFGGKTRNPWNPEQGSSGSSAGSAAATAAGLVAFSIGSETWGSIVSPSTRCGTTGLRPTFGRVSRTGAMALSWTMDKIGPICRSADDCALVLDVIQGADSVDPSVIEKPFQYTGSVNLSKMRIGFLASEFDSVYENSKMDQAVLEYFQLKGATLVPVSLPDYPVSDLAFILSAEAAAAFDELTRSNRDDELVRQIKNAWPNEFRVSRFIPAVEYIQANRIRYLLIQEMNRIMKTVDMYIAPTFIGNNLLLTNLTGHPCVVLPNGFDENGNPVSITLIGKLFDEATLLAVARNYQMSTKWDDLHPPLFKE